MRLPERAMVQREVETAWAADRAALVECDMRHAETVRFYRDRDRRLRAGPAD